MLNLELGLITVYIGPAKFVCFPLSFLYSICCHSLPTLVPMIIESGVYVKTFFYVIWNLFVSMLIIIGLVRVLHWESIHHTVS